MSDHDTPVAVVTGANSGIGRATALHLGTNGFHVVATARSAAKVEKLMSRAAEMHASIELVELDVTDDESVKRGFASILGNPKSRSNADRFTARTSLPRSVNVVAPDSYWENGISDTRRSVRYRE